MDYVVENWVEENKVAIESTLRNEIMEEFIDGLKGLFVEHYIEVPESKIDVIESLAEKVDSLEQLKEVVTAGAKLILLDNMSLEQCRTAVEIVGGRAELEASGGLTIENAGAYAKTGVDYLAVGALTHSAPVLDIGLDMRME